MRNDVHFPPPPGDPDPSPDPRRKPAVGGRPVARPRSAQATHPHPADRAHSLNSTSDRAATGPLYETPEDRGGIDSTTLSIIVVSVVAIVLFVIFWTVFRTANTPTVQPSGDVPNATIIDDAPKPEEQPTAEPAAPAPDAPAAP